jgi:hypothetical protein
MHKYNNQDYSMMMAMLAAENILVGQDGSALRRYDVWLANQNAEYHEEDAAEQSGASGERLIPARAG